MEKIKWLAITTTARMFPQHLAHFILSLQAISAFPLLRHRLERITQHLVPW
jgi:hypothetical protein